MATTKDIPETQVVNQIQQVLQAPKTPDFESISIPLVQAEQARLKADCEAQGGTFADEVCTLPLPVYAPVVPPPVQVDQLTGSLGYSLWGGNCVLEPGVNNPGYGNPINWPVLYSNPFIGATVLFTFNHTAVVTGMWSNGDIEVRQQNAGGMPHRIPRWEIRGFR